MINTERKSLLFILLTAAIIMPAAFFFSVAADLPQLLITVIVGLGLSLAWRKPVRLNDRTVIYFGVIILIFTVLFDYVLPMDKTRFGYISIFFYPNITVPVMLYTAVALTFFSPAPYIIGFASGVAFGCMMLGSDIYVNNLLNARMFMFSFLLTELETFFLVTVILEVAAVIVGVKYAAMIKSGSSGKQRWRKWVILSAILVAIPLTTISLMKFYKSYEDSIRKLENILMRAGMRRMRYNQHIVFGNNVDLNRTISEDVLENQDMILLRAETQEDPGYLRGKVYTIYKNGKWDQPADQQKRIMKAIEYSGMLAFKTFYYHKDDHAKVSIEIYPTRNFSSSVLLVPGNSQKFELIADRLYYSENGEMIPEDWEQDGGYTALVPKIISDSANQIEDDDAAMYLQVPSNITATLDKVLKEILPKDSEQKTKLEMPRLYLRLVNYFHENFKYKLRAQNNEDTDPVVHFLTQTREGHCELFAASTALLLRRYGIKTRYITGFICSERHPSGRYFVSRLGNAHAWIEAWNSQTKRWELLEPTPPSGVPNFKHKWGFFESWGDRAKQVLQGILLGLRRGYFAKAIVLVFVRLFELIMDLLWNPIGGPLFLGLCIYLYRRRKKRLAGLRPKQPDKLPDNIIALQKEFKKLERSIKNKLKIERPEHMTISDFAGTLSQNGAPEELISFLHNYQSVRFSPEPPSDELTAEFKKQMRKISSGLTSKPAPSLDNDRK